MADPAPLNITDALIAAVAAYFDDHNATGELLARATIVPGWNSSDQLPNYSVTIVNGGSEPEILGLGPTGNETVTLEIAARTHVKDKTAANMQTLQAGLDTILKVQNLAEVVTYYGTNIKVKTAYIRGAGFSTVGTWRIATRRLECYVVGLDPDTI